MRTPNFNNLLKVLRREVPDRPTLFELFLNEPLNMRLAGWKEKPATPIDQFRLGMQAFAAGGYDYSIMLASDLLFPSKEVKQQATRSMNDTAIITDRASFDAYPWPDPDSCDCSCIDTLSNELPEGMQFIVISPGGVLENVMQLVGYEPLCLMLSDDPALARDIFDAVGSRLLRYYELAAPLAHVGALFSNDDWGYSTQTMLAPDDLRRYVFPWHKRIVAVIHAAGKPAILHCCGNVTAVMDDIIDDMRFDAKHSFEDKIEPIEEVYEHWGSRIAILGGIDLDFICRSTPEAVTARARAMLQRTATRGGYALGTGISVPTFLPDQQYFALTRAALEW